MRIKKYIVKSIPDAMQQIKHDLGQNAIILNTKKIKTGGFLGFFTREEIEVIAAIDQEKKVTSASKSPSNLSPVSGSETSVPSEVLSNSNTKTDAESALAFTSPTKKTELDHEDLNKELLGELKNMKKFMLSMFSEKEDKLPAVLQEVNQLFVRQEIDHEIRSEMMGKLLLKLENEPECPDVTIKQWVKEELLTYLSSMQTESKETSSSRLICFIGPTGVGKTTTIAKLAADMLLKHKKKVGFITSDTYRIAAVEQLKTYATILNIPIEVVFSPEDLKPALEKLNSCDTILMDTAGRNYLQKEYIEELEDLIPSEENIQTNLVLSLTSKYEDLTRIIHNFNQIDVDCLILTKLDETSSYGAILNLIYKNSFPLTYMTNGQNVPDDILIATPELITELILGEDAHERSS
jgi:flagellar biosynthesis protein FlhF